MCSNRISIRLWDVAIIVSGSNAGRQFGRIGADSSRTLAHDGYLEIYLDGGMVGCLLLGLFLIFSCWRLSNLFSPANSLFGFFSRCP